MKRLAQNRFGMCSESLRVGYITRKVYQTEHLQARERTAKLPNRLQ